MKQSGASSARAGMTDSGIPVLADLFGRMQSKARVVVLSAHPNNATPRLWKIVSSESFLRKLISTLIALLLIAIAFTRTAMMVAEYRILEHTNRFEVRMSASLAARRLVVDPVIAKAEASASAAEAILEASLRGVPVDKGRIAFLIGRSGKVLAHSKMETDLVGTDLSRLLKGNALLQTMGARADVMEINLDGMAPSWASYRLLSVDDEPVGGLLFVQKKADALFLWSQNLRIDIALFAAVGIVLLVVLYAYLAQGKRSRVAENLYSEINARFDTALARGHCGMWDWDLSRGTIVWSRSMYEMLGLKCGGGVLGFGQLKDLLHPSDQDLLTLANNAFESQKQQIDHRFRVMHASGSWVWIRLRAELVKYRGSYPHLIGIAVDISEQEALKQKSRDADIRLRDAIENISEAFVLWDARKRLVLCNTKYQELYKLPASAIESGTHYNEVREVSRKPRVRKQIDSTGGLEHGAQTFEVQIEDGRWLQINERRTQDGGFVSLGTDITQIKRNEEKLVDSEHRLMATIADLRNNRQEMERQAQKLVQFADTLNEEKQRANEANEAKSEFLANISHELRTPLNAIIGFSDIMRSGMFGPLGSDKYAEYADDIHHSGSFLLGVINDVLDMSKIEAGRFQLMPEQVQVRDLLEETLRIIQIQADEAGIDVSESIPESMKIKADRRAVKQILINLLSNAVKFTPQHGRIEVAAKQSRSSVYIIVRDNGCGISKEALRRLGQPFEQVQDQFTKDHKGSGLGLAIARSLSILHGGALKIRSEVGTGTMVVVRLPVECREPHCNEGEEQLAA